MAPSLLHDNNTIQLMIYYGRFFKLAEILAWVENAKARRIQDLAMLLKRKVLAGRSLGSGRPGFAFFRSKTQTAETGPAACKTDGA